MVCGPGDVTTGGSFACGPAVVKVQVGLVVASTPSLVTVYHWYPVAGARPGHSIDAVVPEAVSTEPINWYSARGSIEYGRENWLLASVSNVPSLGEYVRAWMVSEPGWNV